jgi:hypothetical protein
VGFFPLDEQLGVVEQHCSEQVAKQAVWLCGQVDDDFAEAVLSQIGGVHFSDTSIWRQQQRWGEHIRLNEALRAEAANALPLRGQVGPTAFRDPTNRGVALDGAMIFVRKEGWKELKAGCVFDIALQPEIVKTSGETEWSVRNTNQAHAINTSYLGVLGGPEKFGQHLWAEALRRRMPQAHDSVVCGDGAPWIWNLALEHFGDSRQVVDWYHATQHLYKAAHLAFGEGSAEAIQQAKTLETPLYQGHATQVAETLREWADEVPSVAKELRSEAGYFETNQRRMQYLELREDGFPIGSGMVESGCKQFRARFNGPGMRWSREGAERMIPVRAAIMSDRFDQVWRAAYKSPR